MNVSKQKDRMAQLRWEGLPEQCLLTHWRLRGGLVFLLGRPFLRFPRPQLSKDSTGPLCHLQLPCPSWSPLLPSFSGVFVKLRDRHRHPECYVCTDCGTNLKQKGHFFVEDQIYCEKHARERVTPPEGYDVVTVFPK